MTARNRGPAVSSALSASPARRDQISRGTASFPCAYVRPPAVPGPPWAGVYGSRQMRRILYRGSLFCAVLKLAEENGDFEKARPILDYVLPEVAPAASVFPPVNLRVAGEDDLTAAEIADFRVLVDHICSQSSFCKEETSSENSASVLPWKASSLRTRSCTSGLISSGHSPAQAI